MNKLFTKIAALALGAAMVVGVGVSAGSNLSETRASAGDSYNLVKNVSDLAAGDEILFGYTNGSDVHKASGALNANTGSYLKAEDATISNEVLTYTGTAVKPLTLGKSGNNWTFTYGTTTVATTAAKKMCISTTSKSVSTWTISITTAGVATITSTTSSYGTIKYNTQSPRFLNYASGQASIGIYKKASSTDTLNSVNIATSAGSTQSVTSGSVEKGKTLQLYLTANWQTAGAKNVTTDAVWTIASADQTYATVSEGLVSGKVETSSAITITASYGGKSAEYSLSVVIGPTVTTSVHSINMLTNVTREDITITTANWSSDPTISASSNNTNALVASINAQGKLKLVTQDVYADATVEVTVSATLGSRTETDKVIVSVKAPTLTLIDNVPLKPKQAAVSYTATVTNFDNDVALEVDDFDSTVIGVSVDGLTITITPKKEGDTSITVLAYDGNGRMIDHTITVSVKDSDSYTLVTDVTSLFDGAKIIIANSSSNVALSTTQNNNNRAEESVSISDGILNDPSSDVQIIELEADGNTGYYYLKVGDSDYLYAPSGNSNYLRTSTKTNSHSWTISVTSEGAATIEASPSTLTKYLRYNSGSSIFSCYSSASQQGIGIYLKDEAAVAVEDTKLVGTVSAKTGDTAWNTSGLTFSVLYEGDSEYTDIPNSQVTFTVTESVPAITETTTTKVHVTASLKTDTDVKAENVELTANLTYENIYSIERLYTESIGTTITIYGQFMGSYGVESSGSLVAQDGIFVGNGEYAALVYKCTANIGTSGLNLIAYTSYVKVTGVISEYRGLRELGSTSAAPTLTKVESSEAAPFFSPIIDYTFTGNEDATTHKNLASRPALVEGEVTDINGTFASNSNTTVTIELSNSNSVNVFLKANQSIDYDGLKAACVEGANIKLKVFVSIFAASNTGTPYFQLVNPTLIEVSETYFAIDFANDLLDDTDAVCKVKQDGNAEALVEVWRDLKNNKFSTLAEAQVTILQQASPNYDDVEITAQTTDAEIISFAMGRYNLIAKKYAKALGDMANFIGRTDVNDAPINPLPSTISLLPIVEGNSTTIIIIVSAIGVSALGGFFFLRKRKEI